MTKRNLNIEIVICGTYVIHLLGYSRSEYTLDVNSITELASREVRQLIEAVGQKLGIGPHWLNDQASPVSLPTGVLSRATPIKHWKSIKASLVSRANLIKMKASAFSIRRDLTNKDWEDLVLLKPTYEEMSDTEFKQMANYFGIAIQANLANIGQKDPNFTFMDIELFFLSATL